VSWKACQLGLAVERRSEEEEEEKLLLLLRLGERVRFPMAFLWEIAHSERNEPAAHSL